MHFTKMHGLGNDFIIINGDILKGKSHNKAANILCNRNRGIGADGLILYFVSDDSELQMKLLNSDGSEADMCGNGLRCLSKFAFDRKLVKSNEFNVKTGAGIMKVRISGNEELAENIEINMGKPSFKRGEIPVTGNPEDEFINEQIETALKSYTVTCLKVGVPHCIVFVDDFNCVSLREEGSSIEKHSVFPKKTNVLFVNVENPGKIQVKVWERGAGETQACGTGACAALVASHIIGKSDREAQVLLPGGKLMVRWDNNDDIYMKGPAEEIFIGEINIERLMNN